MCALLLLTSGKANSLTINNKPNSPEETWREGRPPDLRWWTVVCIQCVTDLGGFDRGEPESQRESERERDSDTVPSSALSSFFAYL